MAGVQQQYSVCSELLQEKAHGMWPCLHTGSMILLVTFGGAQNWQETGYLAPLEKQMFCVGLEHHSQTCLAGELVESWEALLNLAWSLPCLAVELVESL